MNVSTSTDWQWKDHPFDFLATWTGGHVRTIQFLTNTGQQNDGPQHSINHFFVNRQEEHKSFNTPGPKTQLKN